MVDKSITPLILIMQRLHQNDPTGHVLEKKELIPIRHIRLPARLNDSVRPRSLRKHYVKGLFDPQRLPDEILVQTLADMGEYAFAGQYGQHPIPMGGGMFRVDQIEICRTAPTMFRLIRYWDKAGSAGKGAWTVGVKMGLDKDRVIWILDVVRGQWEAALRERIIKQTVTSDDKKKIIVGIEQEPGSGGKESAQSTVKNLFGFRIMVDRPTGDKALRADPFATQVNGGNVKILAAPWNSVYLAELQFFPFSKWKDQVDASSGAFSLLTKVKRVVGAL
jgi:predicted phage terminase large subunit-like protein